jgi:CDP-L-myo-inositol myo-inositolphosphotransferase
MNPENKLLSKPTDGFISRYLNRRISIKITTFIIRHEFGVKPNQVSIATFLLSIATLPIYLYGYPLLAGILVQAASILDGVDGELARLTGHMTKFGKFLDSFLDRLSDVFIIFGCSLYALYYQDITIELLLIISLLAVSSSLLVSYIHGIGESTLGMHPALIGRLKGIATRDIRLFIIFLFSLFGIPFTALVLISVLAYIYLIVKLVEISIRIMS